MAFPDDYLGALESIAANAPPPRVKSLHLPVGNPDLCVDNRGEFCALELEDGSLGLSYVLLDGALSRLRAADPGLGLAGLPALDVARGFLDRADVRRTIGFAAANAITRWLFSRAGYRPADSPDSLCEIPVPAAAAVGMVGYFPPLIPPLMARQARLTVLELDERLLDRGADRFVVTLDPTRLEGCEVVVSTGTVLLNHTLDAMLGHCRAAREIALIGPSVGCLPDPLLARGVTLLGGTEVEDRDGFVDALRTGQRWGPFARKTAIRGADYPGLPALLRRLRAGAPPPSPGPSAPA
jgi:uncharacterized protein (DUF4213/DUF364 family)